MIKANSAARAFQKRTIRPLYAWHSAVPYACFLDAVAVGTTIVYPGMVAVKTTGEQMDIANNAAATNDVPFGLFNNFINGDMDELQGGTEISTWVGGRDAVFEVLAGPTTSETPLANRTFTTLNATRGGVAMFADTNGRLTDEAAGGAGGSNIQAVRLIEAVSNTKLIVQLILATA